MADKLTDIFQVSRMMLPEHKARIKQQYMELKNPKRDRPVLDQQEMEDIGRKLMESKELKHPVKVRLYDPYEELMAVGVIERIEPVLGWFQVDGERFQIKDIISADVVEEIHY